MARSEEKAANTNTTTGQSLESGLMGSAGTDLNTLMPAFQNEVTNPAGFSAPDMSRMQTAAEQSAGGSEAAAIGQGNLEAARTRNAGGFAPAIDSAARGAGETLSKDALGIQNQDALLKQKQQQEGLTGLEGLYGEQLQGGENALNLSNGAINAGTNASNSTNQEWLGPLDSIIGNATTPKKDGFGFG